MKTINNPALKVLIFDVICFTDNVDEKGVKIKRQSFPKKYFKAFKQLESKLKSQIDIVTAPKSIERKDVTENDLVYIRYDDFIARQKEITDSSHVIVEMFKREDELNLTDDEIAAIKYFYSEREELYNVDENVFLEFEDLIN